MIKFEYIWVGGNGELRSKVKVENLYVSKLNNSLKSVFERIKEWNYDGSSTNQASGSDSEVILKPVSCYYDPFNKHKGVHSYLVLCETYKPDGTPHLTNNRTKANEIFENKDFKKNYPEPMFGVELEFLFMILKLINL